VVRSSGTAVSGAVVASIVAAGRKRQEEIMLSLPNAIDLLIVAVEVGQGLDQAICRVTKELERNSRALA
jgi:tight adherence protein C